MYDLFERIPLENEEKLSEKRAEDIKAAVLSRIKEENNMSKHLTIKTISMAAAIAATAMMSAIAANADVSPARIMPQESGALPAETQGDNAPETNAAPEANETEVNAAPEANNAPAANETAEASEAEKKKYDDNLPDGKYLYVYVTNNETGDFKTVDIFVPEGKKALFFDSLKEALEYPVQKNIINGVEYDTFVGYWEGYDKAYILVDE